MFFKRALCFALIILVLEAEEKGGRTRPKRKGVKILMATHSDHEYVLGHKVNFLCHAEGTPRPYITWFKDGAEIFAHVQIGLPVSSKYRYPDSEQYYNNNDGAKICMASHFDIEYLLRHKVVFLCHAKGTPRPNITWFKDGVEIFERHYIHIHEWLIGDDQVKSKIEINPATPMDEGMYECTADNMYSIDRRFFQMPLTGDPSKPTTVSPSIEN